MGSHSSGRRSDKRCTDEMWRLDVREFNCTGLLRAGQVLSWEWTRNGKVAASIGIRVEADRVVLNYQNQNRLYNGGDWESISSEVLLDWTPCGFGGRRVWWRCPGAGCGRRVAVLHGGRVYACRQCHGLAYRSQRENEEDRAIRRAGAIRRRLGWVPGIANGSGPKPKGMHWPTFYRLMREHHVHANAAVMCMAAALGLPRR